MHLYHPLDWLRADVISKSMQRPPATDMETKRQIRDSTQSFDKSPIAWILLGSGAFFLLLVIRVVLFQPFNIPSGSNIPTLLIGDYLFVSKYSYGYSHYSLPFSPPIFTGRILSRPVDRGDVVVFRLPKDDSTDYLKRVVGLSGDRIQMIGGLLNINGQPVKRERIEDFTSDEDGAPQPIKQYRETLPNGVTYATLALMEKGFFDNTQVYTVPPGHYFMMGDNRDNSTDSRMLSASATSRMRTSSARRRSSSSPSGAVRCRAGH